MLGGKETKKIKPPQKTSNKTLNLFVQRKDNSSFFSI
jgi:hypothetical protein